MKKYLEIFWTFFKIGLFTFGGGYVMINIMSHTIVNKKGWLTEDKMFDLLVISESTPGPFAINGATYIGYKHAKFWGSFFATLGVILPSFIIILLIAKYSEKFLKTKQAKYILSAIQPMVLGFILSAFLSVTLTTILGNYFTEITFDYKALIIFGVILFLGLFVKKIPPIGLILISMLLGIIIYGI